MKKNQKDPVESYFRSQYGLIALAIFLSLVIGGFSLAPLVYMREVYGSVVMSRSLSTLMWITVALGLSLVFAAAVDWYRQRLFMALGIGLYKSNQGLAFDASFSTDRFQGRTGESSALSDLRELKNFFLTPTPGAVMDAPVGFLILGTLFLFDSLIGLFALIGASVSALIWLGTDKLLTVHKKNAMNLSQELSLVQSEITNHSEVIRAMGLHDSLYQKWRLLNNKYICTQFRLTQGFSVGSALMKISMLLQGSILLFIGTLLILSDSIPPEQAASLIFAKLLGMLAIRPLIQLAQSWRAIGIYRECRERLAKTLLPLEDDHPLIELPPPSGELRITKASVVAQALRHYILHDINILLRPGQCVGIIGNSGSGKSTLARLACGIIKPNSGDVRLDGVAVHEWPRSQLAPHIGFVSQSLVIFDGTIAQNVSRFSEYSLPDIWSALELVGMREAVEALPEGVESQVSLARSPFSFGQLQRIAIARAFYKEPRFVIFDEPTSNLDKTGSALFKRAVVSAKARGASILLTTHDRDVLDICEKLMLLKQGRTMLWGRRDDVLEKMRQRSTDGPKVVQSV